MAQPVGFAITAGFGLAGRRKGMLENKTEQQAREEILSLAAEYYREFQKPPAYRKGGRIPYAGRVYDEREVRNLVDSALTFWLTSGEYTAMFEEKLSNYLGVKY